MTTLQVVWFFLIGGMLAVYVILDGYDLGIGFWHITCRDTKLRKALRSAIAPYWDANEVWLIAAGALLFAAFPKVYAAVFSAFYLPLTLLLAALILRAVSLDFASHETSDAWRSAWEWAFGAGSSAAAFAFGFAAGNILRGLTIDENAFFVGSIYGLVNTYSLLVGATGMVIMLAHSSYFAQIRLGPPVSSRARTWGNISGASVLMLYGAAFVFTVVGQRHLIINYQKTPALWCLPASAFVLFAAAAACNAQSLPKRAFAFSCAGIAALFASLGSALYPRLDRQFILFTAHARAYARGYCGRPDNCCGIHSLGSQAVQG